MRWERAGTDPARVGADIDSCQLQGNESLARSRGPALPRATATDPRFVSPDAMQLSPAERSIEVQQIADACMREKGYRLVPASK